VIPAVDTRTQYDHLASLYAPVAILVYLVVTLTIVVVVVSGRRRRRDPSARKNDLRLELAYALLLVLVVPVLLVFTYNTESRIDEPQARPVETIRVVAARWTWRFEYPTHGFAQRPTAAGPATLVVPAGEPVAFVGRSDDVIHAFWIPGLRFQRQLFVDHVDRWQLTFRRSMSGESAPCSFYCGLDHYKMRFRVEVLAPDRYAAWVRSREARS
jgi:cytochrome c oxidase subunit 2